MRIAPSRHRSLALLVGGLAMLATACGAERVAGSSATSPSTVAGAEPSVATRDAVALLSTESGITAVEVGTTDVRWSAPGAVAALDGSAVFARDSGALVRLDPRTGEEVDSWPVDAALNPIVVAPDGAWVALTDRPAYRPVEPPAPRTQLVVVNGRTGELRFRFDLVGDVEPEAFASERLGLVLLDHRSDGIYRVETLDLRTGLRAPTIDENKNEVGDMAGRRLRGVLSEDELLLATLYQIPNGPEPGAFVHVLHLNGWTYCVGLPSQFGTGPDGTVTIERHGDDIVVISEHANQRARFSLSQLQSWGTANLKVDVSVGAGERADAPYRSVPGFRALVGVSPTPASSPASPSSAGARG